MNFFQRIKKLIQSLFEREKSTEYLLEDKQSQIQETETTDLIDDYLFSIQDILAKLELINISHGKTDELTSKLLDYNNKLSNIQNKYLDFDRNNTNIENYSKRTGYLLELSTLLDELKLFSKTYFYLEDLNVFKQVETTTENIESRKEELIELETNIYSYHANDKETDDKLHTTLNTIIYEMLKKEVELNTSRDLYDNLSYVSRLEIKKLFLKELAEKASENSKIKEYIDKNNITLIDFSYDNLLLLVDNTSKVNNDVEIVNENKYDKTLVGLKDLDKKIEAFSKKIENIDIYDITNYLEIHNDISLDINITREKIDFDYDIDEIEIINIVGTEYYYLLAGKIKDGQYEVIGELKLSSDRCESDVARIFNLNYTSVIDVIEYLKFYDYEKTMVLKCFKMAYNKLKDKYDDCNEKITKEKTTNYGRFNVDSKKLEKKIEEFYLTDRESKHILKIPKITPYTSISFDAVFKVSKKTINVKCPINKWFILKEKEEEYQNYYLMVGNDNFSRYKIIGALSVDRFIYKNFIKYIYIDKLSYKKTKRVIDLFANLELPEYEYRDIIKTFSILYKEYMEYDFNSNKDTIFNANDGFSYNPGEVSDGLKQLTKTLKF